MAGDASSTAIRWSASVPTERRARHAAWRSATATAGPPCDSPIGPAGTALRGHEFHYSTCDPAGDALAAVAAASVERTDGFASPTLLATYLHQHAGGDPAPAEQFVRTCAG